MIPMHWSPKGHEVKLMAKQTKSAKKKNTQKNVPRQRKKRMGGGRVNIDRQLTYAQLLQHPDNGQMLADGVYGGELGNFQRFTNTFTLNGSAGQNSGFIAYCPATGNGYGVSTAASNTALTFSLTNVGFPGAAFLGLNAAKTRGIAAKIEAIPAAASITTLTGEICCGVTTIGNFVSGVTSVNDLFDISKAYGPIQRKTVISRWFPSGLDHTYSNYNVVPDEDRHMVFIAYRGWPVAVPINVRLCSVVEYTIKNAIGISPSGSLSTPVDHEQVIRAVQNQDPHWHHSLMDEVKSVGRGVASDLGVFARTLVRHGLSTLGNQMVKQAPRALPLLLA